MRKLISIIIATYNAEKVLQACLDSIIYQLTEEIELIIIDGNSTDDTVNIIQRNENFISYWISNRDDGIYDAWNKGLDQASGEWFMFLGADDRLISNALNIYVHYIRNENHKELDYISSRVRMVDKNGVYIRTKGWPWVWPEILKETMTAHPGSLHSKNFFDTYGKYDIKYKIVGDTELILRAKGNLKYAFLNVATVEMMEGGASDSLNAIKERYKVNVMTGNCKKYLAFYYALIVSVKFLSKKMFRLIGLNVYLKK